MKKLFVVVILKAEYDDTKPNLLRKIEKHLLAPRARGLIFRIAACCHE
jgi:hypothetical protein